METLFWILLLFIFYTYLGYPLLIYVLSVFRAKPVHKSTPKIYPKVSVVIAARNEEKNIERRIKNLFEQDYPKECLELIIISDGSQDFTDTIVNSLMTEYQSLKLIKNIQAKGKPTCINKGVAAANGEFIVFADCRQQFAKDAIKQLVANFSDSQVGCVSGELVFEETPGSTIQAEMGAYWNFEKWLRKMESKSGSVPGATGAIYAIKKCLFDPVPEEILLDDVMIPLKISKNGQRIVFDKRAVAYDTISKDINSEKHRKIRTLVGNWQLLVLAPGLLNPIKNPLWFRFIFHKFFRLLIPYAFLMLLGAAFYLRDVIAILFLICVGSCGMLAVLPVKSDAFIPLKKITKALRSIIFLNYFAFLAPFKLMAGPKNLW